MEACSCTNNCTNWPRNSTTDNCSSQSIMRCLIMFSFNDIIGNNVISIEKYPTTVLGV